MVLHCKYNVDTMEDSSDTFSKANCVHFLILEPETPGAFNPGISFIIDSNDDMLQRQVTNTVTLTLYCNGFPWQYKQVAIQIPSGGDRREKNFSPLVGVVCKTTSSAPQTQIGGLGENFTEKLPTRDIGRYTSRDR